MNKVRQATNRSSGRPSVPPRVPAPGANRSTGEQPQQKMPPGRVWLWFGIALLLNYTIMSYLMPNPDAPVTVPYTLFREEVAKRNVESIYARGETMSSLVSKRSPLRLTHKSSVIPAMSRDPS